MIRASLLMIALASAPACTPQSSAAPAAAVKQPAVHPVSGLKIIPVTVTTGKRTHVFRAELALSDQEQARGLMFRTVLGPDEGMLFPRQPIDIPGFWMRNTPLPLDIIFVGTDRRVLNIAARTTPYSLESVSAVGLSSAVFEIPGGRAAELGIVPGSKVEW